MAEKSSPSQDNTKQTNFTILSSMAVLLSVRQEREEPKFDGKKAAFCVSKGSIQSLLGLETKHVHYPLAAKAATISLSNFNGSNLGFDAFCKKLHKQDPSQSGDYRKHGYRRMTRSYRNVQPIVAKVFNIEYKWMPEIMIAISLAAATNLTSQRKLRQILMMGAMAKASNLEYKCMSAIIKAIAKYLTSQPRHQELLLMAAVAMGINFLTGIWLERAEDFSSPLVRIVLTTMPHVSVLGHMVLMPNTTMAFTIGATILGYAFASMAEQYRLRAIKATSPPLTEASVGGYDPAGEYATAIFLIKIMLVIFCQFIMGRI